MGSIFRGTNEEIEELCPPGVLWHQPFVRCSGSSIKYKLLLQAIVWHVKTAEPDIPREHNEPSDPLDIEV